MTHSCTNVQMHQFPTFAVLQKRVMFLFFGCTHDLMNFIQGHSCGINNGHIKSNLVLVI